MSVKVYKSGNLILVEESGKDTVPLNPQATDLYCAGDTLGFQNSTKGYNKFLGHWNQIIKDTDLACTSLQDAIDYLALFFKASSAGGAELTSDAEFSSGIVSDKAPTAKQSKDYTDSIAAAGGINPSVFVPTSSSDFTAPSALNASKTWELQTDITLTGDATLLEGIDLKAVGGRIHLNGFTLTGVSTRLIPDNMEVLINAFSGTLAGSWLPPHTLYTTNIGANPNGLITTDNYNALKNFLFVRNQVSGRYVFTPGHYYVDIPARQTLIRDEPTGLVFGNGVNDIDVFMGGSKIQMIPNDLDSGSLLTIYNTDRYKFEGGELIGDYDSHVGSLKEFYAGIHITTAAYNGEIRNMNIHDFQGDGIYADGDTQFTNYIKGSAIGTGVATMIQGAISDLGVIDTTDTAYAYTDNIIDIGKSQFVRAKELSGINFFALTGSSFGGWAGMKYPRYRIAYYNSEGVFQEKTGWLDFYSAITNFGDYPGARVEIDMPDDLTIMDLQLRADLNPSGLYLSNVNSWKNGRQGGSNLPCRTTWANSKIYENGGRTPGCGIDIEDQRRSARDYNFINLTFRDNAGGDIFLVGTEDVKIMGCTFDCDTKVGWSYGDTCIGAATARNTIITGNIIKHGRVILDRNDSFDNNKTLNAEISFTANGNTITNNKFHNTKIICDQASTANRVKSLVKDNKFTYDVNMFEYFVSERCNGADWINNDFLLNDITKLSNLVTDPASCKVTMRTAGSFFAAIASVTGFGGKWEGNRILGGYAYETVHSDYLQDTVVPIMDMKDSIIEGSISPRYGMPISFEWDNVYVDGWCRFMMEQFGNVLSDDRPVANIKNSTFIAKAGKYLGTNTGFNILRTYSHNVDFKFTGCSFINENATSAISSANKYMKLSHLGTTLFDNCTFYNATPLVLDFTNTLIFPAPLLPITIIDPVLTNVSFALRAGDKLLFTKADINMPIYSDNDDAVAQGYEDGYAYRTPNGAVSLVYYTSGD